MDERTAGDRVVGVVGDTTGGVVPWADHRGATASDLPVAELDLAVAVGPPAVSGLADAGVPVLPVSAGRGIRSVAADAVEGAIGRFPDGEWTVDSYPVVSVSMDGRTRARSVFDVTLMTGEPAHISEYAVRTADERVTRVRADGIVVATPAGSPDYARAAGGPVVAPGTGVGVVVPVAPFVTDPDHWVLDLSTVQLSVERDSVPVSLVVDGDRVDTLGADDTVTLAHEGTLSVLRVPESASPFDAGAGT